jgi:hypothetical protein
MALTFAMQKSGPTLASGPALADLGPARTFSRNPVREVRQFGQKLERKIIDSERNKRNWG